MKIGDPAEPCENADKFGTGVADAEDVASRRHDLA
jgi:hypothetical protein